MSQEIVLGLQKRVETAKVRRARAEAALEQATDSLRLAQETLAEWGVDTPEQAAALLKQLTEEFETERALIEEGLRDLEG